MTEHKGHGDRQAAAVEDAIRAYFPADVIKSLRVLRKRDEVQRTRRLISRNKQDAKSI